MKSIIIIPARYGSQRFPGKLLADLGGKSVLARTMDRCAQARKSERVLVATDDERILKEVEDQGEEGILTQKEHRSGTERCAEALERAGGTWDIVVNVQGDEPFILPEQIDRSIELFEEARTDIGTLCREIEDPAEFRDPNRVKVVRSPDGGCLYFSRSPIPYSRETDHVNALQHIGIYAYRSSILPRIASLEPTPLEEQEGLEQLRWLENGYRIRAGVSMAHQPGIDSPEDLERARKQLFEKANEGGRSGDGSA